MRKPRPKRIWCRCEWTRQDDSGKPYSAQNANVLVLRPKPWKVRLVDVLSVTRDGHECGRNPWVRGEQRLDERD
jgi:hypothetical protein